MTIPLRPTTGTTILPQPYYYLLSPGPYDNFTIKTPSCLLTPQRIANGLGIQPNVFWPLRRNAMFIVKKGTFIIPLLKCLPVSQGTIVVATIKLLKSGVFYSIPENTEQTTHDWYFELLYTIKPYDLPVDYVLPGETMAVMLDEPDGDVMGFLTAAYEAYDLPG